MNQCSATKANGERCPLPAKGSRGLCWTHAPENAAKRRRNASKAATAKADKEIRETKAEIRELYQTLLQYIVVERGIYREDDLAQRIRELSGK